MSQQSSDWVQRSIDWLKRNYRSSIIFVLIVFLILGILWYWNFRRRTETELLPYVERLEDEGMIVIDRSLVDSNVKSISGIRNFTIFLNYAKQENLSKIYVERHERALYFLHLSIEDGIEIVKFYYAQLFFDWGGVWALMLTALILVWFKVLENIKDGLSDPKPIRSAVILIISSIGIIGIWLTVRHIGRFFMMYVFEEGFRYKQSDVFSIISYIITANLPFRLLWI